ncbi:HDOD domain-containing protein [Candidatus Endoriftia persephone]|uniref:Metal dependent phosphohydrolase n=2 Tax=Gammaproteobacteria TaxID=1236 RepID=G2FCL0_9GAMM|nr:HDOD domain-containing protein [Candidatus Endoriftia persephone]EGW55573.1 metal dependent phosphohydrolase [endosymbiont of Tevnia jerichonana (vent Tica)]USF86720.1 HDOD domain-containing protein [Candidatus Endoriftia persephone]
MNKDESGFSPQAFAKTLSEDLKANRIALPTLPDVALEALVVINDIESSVNDLVKIISRDTALTARLIRYANSPLYRGVNPVSSIKQAITRIGFQKVKSAVYAVSMHEVFHSPNKAIELRMERLWMHSVKIGSTAATLAKTYTDLDPNTALVAGLVQNVGQIPIITKAADYPELVENSKLLDKLLSKLHGKLGQNLLRLWRFDPAIVAVTRAQQELYSERDDEPVDLVDLVQAANILTQEESDQPQTAIDRDRVPAFARLGLPADAVSQSAAMLESSAAVATALF